MKNIKKITGITAIIAVIVFAIAACGDSGGGDITGGHTHTWSAWTDSDPATCTDPAHETRVCAGDPSHTETRDKSGSVALGHLAPAGYPATCTTAGDTGTGLCTRCNDEWITGEVIPALGHDFTGSWLKDVSQHWKECTRCSAISGNGTTESVKTNHSFVSGVCTVCGIPDPTPFFGTWKGTTVGYYGPFTITITADSFRWENPDHNINHADITWTEATNTATEPGFNVVAYYGFFRGANANPSLSYPTGFTISGTRTYSPGGYSTPIPTGFFIALSANGQTLYVAQSSSVYNRAGFASSHMEDSLFTRVP